MGLGLLFRVNCIYQYIKIAHRCTLAQPKALIVYVPLSLRGHFHVWHNAAKQLNHRFLTSKMVFSVIFTECKIEVKVPPETI